MNFIGCKFYTQTHSAFQAFQKRHNGVDYAHIFANQTTTSPGEYRCRVCDLSTRDYTSHIGKCKNIWSIGERRHMHIQRSLDHGVRTLENEIIIVMGASVYISSVRSGTLLTYNNKLFVNVTEHNWTFAGDLY